MRISDTSTPVVALKLFDHCGVGMMRSLGRLRIRVYGVDANPGNRAFSSRYCTGRFVWNAEQEPADKTISFLQDLARRLGQRPILITNGDVLSLFATDHASELQDAFRFRMPASKLARSLSHKWEMYRLAKEWGIPTAETFLPASRREAEEIMASGALTFPVLLKGADSALLEQKTGVRMMIVHNAQEFREKYDELADPEQPNLMLQEYIPGEADSIWMFNGYFNANSDCLAGMVGRKLRQYPAYTGMTSLGVLVKNEQVNRDTRRFLKSVGYQGIVDLGYRFDARNGQYKLLDVNPRIGATFRLFQDQQGLDVLRAYYLDLTGQPVTPVEVREGRKWLVENNDLITFSRLRKDGKITLWKWLRSFWGVKEGGWFAWDDPVPFLRMMKSLVGHFLRWARRSAIKPRQGPNGLERVQNPSVY
ncbi:MAG TPA: carboxylate--amine ligase [Candidatus Angelobacter sp.]|nr:carboxylate--amine ligase [Candidatus Angelobacter sp.]